MCNEWREIEREMRTIMMSSKLNRETNKALIIYKFPKRSLFFSLNSAVHDDHRVRIHERVRHSMMQLGILQFVCPQEPSQLDFEQAEL